ncbi:MAG TPA: anhydro-N-acetylmuramic acid kinase [Candidatus Aquilonibacter sp.]|nr:anhydro-N-acetylmuramic acid kinase [Candidatus Aquilonibacter sp.]
MLAVGLMSGTSLDGIDAALVRIEPRNSSYALELLRFRTEPFDDDLARALRAALPPHSASALELAELNRAMGIAFARAARAVAGALTIDYVASHGQTIFHDGPRHLTLQIADPFVIREALHATVCFDFRSADCAVGGHGAPLVPYVDALLLADRDEDRVAVNIGGIANITALPRCSEPNDVIAFDTGPGVMLIDAFVHARTGGERSMDEDGELAANGTIDALLLEAMLADPYFAAAPPKSTGRERFGAHFLHAHPRLAECSLEDGAATLTELTARTIALGVRHSGLAGARVLCSGGGARNLSILTALSRALPEARIETSDAVGLPIDAKEAIAFAVLGYETLRERAANVPRVTGASRAVPLGAIAPLNVRELLAEVERECLSM